MASKMKPVERRYQCTNGHCIPIAAEQKVVMGNNVNHPAHYNQNPSGIECIDVIEHMKHNPGAAMKYIWRAGLKGNIVEDYEKAIWYLKREIKRIKKFGA